MKTFCFAVVSLLMFSLVGCATLMPGTGFSPNLLLVKDNIQKDYEREYTGAGISSPRFYKLLDPSKAMSPGLNFKVVIGQLVDAAMADPDLTKEERVQLADSVRTLSFEENKYFVYELINVNLHYGDEANIAFVVKDKNGTVDGNRVLSYAVHMSYSGNLYYETYRLVILEEPLDPKLGPYEFTVSYPNKQTKIFSYKP